MDSSPEAASNSSQEEQQTRERGWSAELSLRETVFASLGICLATACVGGLAAVSNSALLLGSFGSSCVLLFAYPRSPFSRGWNFVAGHFISSLVGLVFLHLVGPQWWAMALATGTAFAAMMLTRTIHPPAGSNPLIVYLLSANWTFLWLPTLLGALAIQGIVVGYRNALEWGGEPKLNRERRALGVARVLKAGAEEGQSRRFLSMIAAAMRLNATRRIR